MYENVTYSFYTTVLKRNIIPTATDFDNLKMLNIAYFDSLNSACDIKERALNGIASAICMMCEVDYLANKTMTGEENSGRVSSVSVGGVSESYDKSYANAVIATNIKPVEVQKMAYIRLCSPKLPFLNGVKRLVGAK